jgi:hypothetical protein
MDFVDPVGRQHTGPAAIGDDGQALAHRPVARGQALGGGEQLPQTSAPAPRRPAQRGVKHIVAADDGAAVRLGRRVAGGLRPALSTTTGLALAAERSALMKRRALEMPSM